MQFQIYRATYLILYCSFNIKLTTIDVWLLVPPTWLDFFSMGPKDPADTSENSLNSYFISPLRKQIFKFVCL